MALRIALETPELIMAAAPIAANLPVDSNLDCAKSGRAVSIALVNGLDDPVNPYNGGLVKLLWDDSRGEVRSSEATMNYFRTLASADRNGKKFAIADRVNEDNSVIDVTEWRSISNALRLYTVIGGGHTLPSLHAESISLLGATNRDIDIAEELWSFFQSLPQN